MRKSFLTGRRNGGTLSALKAFMPIHFLMILFYPAVVPAEVTADAAANVLYASNSNVFDLPPHPVEPGTVNIRRSDTYFTEGVAFKVDDFVGRQDVFLSGSATQFHYDHLTELDNTGYQFDGGLNWKLTSILNGKLDVSRTRAMTSFLDTTSTDLQLQTEQRETMNVTLKVAPEWKLNGIGYTRDTDQTQPNAPDLRLSEQSGTIALSYLGLGSFTTGVDAGYLSGRYTGTPVTIQPTYQLSTYQQTTFDLLATYKAGGRSTFNGSIGYSDRVSPSRFNSTSGVTGSLSFQDQLTPKTSITLLGSRAISSYLTTAGSEIDTSAQVSVDWRATFKLDVQLSYVFTYRDFPDQPGIGFPVGTDRVDIQQSLAPNLTYQPTRWLDIKAFANVQTRHSIAAEDELSGTVFGISFTVKTPNSSARQR